MPIFSIVGIVHAFVIDYEARLPLVTRYICKDNEKTTKGTQSTELRATFVVFLMEL